MPCRPGLRSFAAFVLLSAATPAGAQVCPSTALGAGVGHSLALAGGKAYAWGDNSVGQLGLGTSGPGTDATVPQEVATLTAIGNVSAIAAGDTHSLAVVNGNVYAWGTDDFGQLGQGRIGGPGSHSDLPVQVVDPGDPSGFLTGAQAVAAGRFHSLALLLNGQVRAWGANFIGQLGDGSGMFRNSANPVAVSGLTNAVEVSAGGDFSLARTGTGTLFGWGENGDGQLGDGTNNSTDVPVQVSGLSAATRVEAGVRHTLAIEGGQVFAWGFNNSGELGNGSTMKSNLPVQVPGLSGAVAVAGGDRFSLALLAGGEAYGWGRNNLGQLGNGTTSPGPTTSPVLIGGFAAGAEVAGGGVHSLALSSSSNPWAWGANGDGQLGEGSTSPSPLPVGLCSAPRPVTRLYLARNCPAGTTEVSWQAVGGATGYNVYRGTLASLRAGVFDHAQLACGVAGTTHSDPDCTAPAAHYYQVTAVNALGEGSYGPGIPPAAAPCP